MEASEKIYTDHLKRLFLTVAHKKVLSFFCQQFQKTKWLLLLNEKLFLEIISLVTTQQSVYLMFGSQKVIKALKIDCTQSTWSQIIYHINIHNKCNNFESVLFINEVFCLIVFFPSVSRSNALRFQKTSNTGLDSSQQAARP